MWLAFVQVSAAGRRSFTTAAASPQEKPLDFVYGEFIRDLKKQRRSKPGNSKKAEDGTDAGDNASDRDGMPASSRYYSKSSMFAWKKPVGLPADPTAWRGGAFEWEGYRKQWQDKQEKKKHELAWNPYHILGVQKDASQEAIKQAYRSLARELHPDLTTMPKEMAEQQFQYVREAFEILSDPMRRAEVDENVSDEPPPQGDSDEERKRLSPMYQEPFRL